MDHDKDSDVAVPAEQPLAEYPPSVIASIGVVNRPRSTIPVNGADRVTSQGIWGPATASMIYWAFAAVGIGSLPVLIGLGWLTLNSDYRIAAFLGRGDLLFLATVLAAGGLLK
jgi:hypothetical protein